MASRLYIAFALSFSAVSVAATISYSYQRVNVGFGGLTAMNNRGWIVGTGAGGRPYRYRPGIGAERLSNNPGYPADINDAGTVVGFLRRGEHYKAIVRPAGEAWTDIGTLGGNESFARAINEAGQVVGSSIMSDGSTHAFLYSEADGMMDLGTLGGANSSADEINESGQILGHSETAEGELHSFLYTPGVGMVDLTELVSESFNGLSLSDNGVIAGFLGGRFAVYSPTFGIRTPGVILDYRWSINDRGWVVGSDPNFRAFLYVYGQGIMDVNSFVSGLSTTLSQAFDINDRDQILAGGRNAEGVSGFYILSRIREEASLSSINNPEPEAYVLIGAGLAALALIRKRR